jgi:hypothetical protein
MIYIFDKTKVLMISGLLAVTVIVWDYIGNYRICDYLSKNGHEGSCPFVLINVESALILIFPFFLFTLITYFMREEVYKTWVRFAIWWLAISMLLILIMPESETGGFGPQISFGKGDVALLTCVFFVIVSIFLIAWKYWRVRNH